MFYHKFWEPVKSDLLAMLNDFHSNNLNIHRLNFALVTLVPKEENARSMKKGLGLHLRYIVAIKLIFSKTPTFRLGRIASRLNSSE